MDFALTEEELMIRDGAKRIASEKFAPLVATLDRGGGREKFLSNLRDAARAGFASLCLDERYGGANASTVAMALAIDEVAYACPSTAVTLALTNMVTFILQAFGTEGQKEKYLPLFVDGTYASGAFALTEAGAGSDPAGMKTRADSEADGFVLNGEKIFCTSAEYAGLFVVWAVTDRAAPKGKGISLFLVEAGTPGLHVGKAESKMGQRGSATNTVSFENCRIPHTALVGRLNDGFRIAVAELALGRIGIASLALGIARAALDRTKAHVKQRVQFDQPLARFQGLQWMIADREVDVEAAQLLILSAAAKRDRGEPFAREASMAKLFASEAAHRVTDTAIQLHGGLGYVEDAGIERLARDARVTRIYEGASEVQRMIIARHALQ
jgi:alkylation response protein AidB-like acyl-CoA dehydrogenase